jgi:hypothetical protein
LPWRGDTIIAYPKGVFKQNISLEQVNKEGVEDSRYPYQMAEYNLVPSTSDEPISVDVVSPAPSSRLMFLSSHPPLMRHY